MRTAALAALALACAACDAGPFHDRPSVGPRTVHLLRANVGPSEPLAAGAPIELFFDRLLLPFSVTRQTFALEDLEGNFLTPQVAYDPVARAVEILPESALTPCQTYRITLATPGDAADVNGVRAIDGATLDPSTPTNLEFPVACPPGDAGGDAGAGLGVGPGPRLPNVDFCASVLPIFLSKCGGSSCHAGSLPAEGLRLDSPAAIVATAVGRAAEGANTGARAATAPPWLKFGVDMAVVDPQDGPGASWLIYKLLMAVPPPCSSTPGAPACDAGAPAVTSNLHTEPWADLSPSERSTLANLIPGREMPFPIDPTAPLAGATQPLTLDELDRVSFWIQEGAPVCDCTGGTACE